nr:MAG TPA: hypothetical protein [Bacteriophage sp.]DAP20487.1 MAG TPA: hypothetical protein [Caudoviricetes sp.]
MIEAIKEIFMAVGMCVVGLAVYILLHAIIRKFNRWRKNGCKIKCLCKPHVYKIEWHWIKDGETLLVCKKCDKRKQVFIDYDSIKENFH